jgi:valyl-tRNA synthetase
MNELATKYNPAETEDKWYRFWLEKKLFRSVPDHREPYTIVIPPPNVTGVLHMGHMLNNTIQDVLVRRARMLGKNACWVPGTDHASIATEAKVVGKLRDEGINKTDLSRDEFLKHAWDWTHKHGGIILEQLKKLGASCDWDRTCFTMDNERSESVIDVFIDLHKKGYIYRGVRMVNWDPQALTAISDEEVIYKEMQSKLYYVRYKVEGTADDWVTIATTRPETILGDTAVCVHPEDERYQHLKGKRVIVPLVNRSVPIIMDSYVEREFGTGCLKVTPAHDINDYELGIKYDLPSIDIFNDNGTMSEAAELHIGKDRFEVRTLIVDDLKKSGNFVKEEDYLNKVGFSERTNVVIEPKLSLQWFLKMKDLSKPALDSVMNDEIQLIPPKFKNTYRHWMETVRDWCISRQLWWGHRIPAFYLPNSHDFVVAKTAEEALKLAIAKTGKADLKISDLRQDEDVLDTWFSSWLWPISVFDGIRNPENEDIKYYYPTNDLVTAPEILFFWVARMIIAGYEYQKDKPFEKVYLTGIVRDHLGRKMSKSLGNSPDPILLMEKYGADGVRVGMLLCSPAGNDLPFDENLTEQGRNFANKIWNAFRLVKQWNVSETAAQPAYAASAIQWFAAQMNERFAFIEEQFKEYRLSDALMAVYKLFWDDFAAWYLEAIKPPYGEAMDKATYAATCEFFEKLLLQLHPFMPFITEELWHHLKERGENESIMLEQLPKAEEFDTKVIEEFEIAKETITVLRSIRQDKNIPFRDSIALQINAKTCLLPALFHELTAKSCNLSEIKLVDEKSAGAIAFMVRTMECFVPLADRIDVAEEIEKLKKELDYYAGFRTSVQKKLSNEKFVAGAPAAVVDAERKKLADAESKIKAIDEQIGLLRG